MKLCCVGVVNFLSPVYLYNLGGFVTQQGLTLAFFMPVTTLTLMIIDKNLLLLPC